MVLRFQTYDIVVDVKAKRYMERVLACPELNQWITAALQETEVVDVDEAGVPH
ncbi:glutathione S-transferase family protein [Paraglaciecola psychrophila 170]|uniref:Glutathione S-transferase family protein n=1 Tax=Paraglaciecola psychrophila 170 TaxID=1129794 RepID=M4RIQ3_9ALTE|nr:glutathione S-transferase family protein [Paraglaciecola psychrophila 170]